MRSHDASKYWSRVYRRDYAVRLSEVSFDHVLGLGSGTVHFAGPITAIVGANGAGKSTLLSVIRASVVHAPGHLFAAGAMRLRDCHITATLRIDDAERRN